MTPLTGSSCTTGERPLTPQPYCRRAFDGLAGAAHPRSARTSGRTAEETR